MFKSPFKTTRSNWSTSLSTVVGMTLTLTMLGLISLLYLFGEKWQEQLREQVLVQVFLEKDMDETAISRVKKQLEAQPYTKLADYVTAEKASQSMEEELGEEFVDFLGYLPIPPSIDLQLEPQYASLDSLNWIAEDIGSVEGVTEVEYQKVLLGKLEENLRRASLPLLVLAGLLLLIAIALINNTIRLSIFSRRFIIKSMQLVGATRGFIRRPFIRKGVWYGIIAGILAFAVIVGLMALFRKMSSNMLEAIDIFTFAKLFGIVVLLGILIAWVSTHFAVNKYIRLRQDQLY
ncbi:MAG: permease-like cell division protein FtsX [Flavobacteriales bacterium]|nr:permease-like cell division protein FtsX [Flavobacteriales bacterium]MDG1779324.1 permease-like cell division protein FtsX [Flavobacteriales bacterium]